MHITHTHKIIKFLDSEFPFLSTDLACRIRGSLWYCQRMQKQPGKLGERNAPSNPLEDFPINTNRASVFGCTLLTQSPVLRRKWLLKRRPARGQSWPVVGRPKEKEAEIGEGKK